MRSDGKVVISTALDNTGLKKGMAGLPAQMSGLTGALKKIGTAVGLAFGAKAIFDFGKAAVELGSNIAEVQNVVDVAFGDMAYKVEQFADTAIESFGMSKLSAKKTASTYMAMARGMGMAEEQASDMALSLTGLTGDVASFFNISQELADTKLKSVFTGETETLKDLGVVMTQTNLSAYALSKGITKDISAMTQAELVSLRYGFVMDQLALAHGDFARTSDSWANQTRILSERWKEFMSVIGQALITVLTPVVKVLNAIVAGLINMANAFNNVVVAIFGGSQKAIENTASQAGQVEAAIGGSVDNQKALTNATKATAKAAKGALATFDELNVLTKQDAGGAGEVAAGMGGGATSTISLPSPDEEISPWAEKIQAILAPLQAISFDNVAGAFERLKEAMRPLGQQLFSGLEWAYYNILVPYAQWGIEEVLPRYLDMFSEALGLLNEVIAACSPGIQWLWDNLLKPIAEWAGGVFLEVLDSITWAIGEFSDWVAKHGDEISGIIKKVAMILKIVWEGTVKPHLERVKEIIGVLFEGLIEFLKNILNSFLTFLNGVLDFLLGVFTGDWKRAWEGVKNIFRGVWNGIADIVESGCNLIVDAVNWVIRQLNKIRIDVPDWVEDLTGMSSFGINIQELNRVKIPRLAQGAVIPANREFLAVLGDQKSGTNIEAPLDTIKQALAEVMAAQGGQEVTIRFTGTGADIVRWLKPELDRENVRRGVNLIKGGAFA